MWWPYKPKTKNQNMRSCCNWSANCVAALQTKKQEEEELSRKGAVQPPLRRMPGFAHTPASTHNHHVLHLNLICGCAVTALCFVRNFGWFSQGLGQKRWLLEFCSVAILFCLFLLGNVWFSEFLVLTPVCFLDLFKSVFADLARTQFAANSSSLLPPADSLISALLHLPPHNTPLPPPTQPHPTTA